MRLLLVLTALLGQACAYLGPPYLYVTFHGGDDTKGVGPNDINTVYKYSRDGYLLGEVLARNETSEKMRSLRGMYISTQGHLHVVNAFKDDSKVLEFSDCDAQGMRHFRRIDTRYDASINPGLIHPYCIDRRFNEPKGLENNTVYISSQDTRSVLRFRTKDDNGKDLDYWQPTKPSAHALEKGANLPGMFVQHDSPDASIRGIALGRSKERWLFVADRNSNKVTVYDSDGGKTLDIDVKDPISLVAGGGIVRLQNTSLMLVGSAEKGDGKILLLDQLTGEKLNTYRAGALLGHPAGITVNDDELYVCSQDTGAIIVFNFTTAEVLRVIVTALPDQPENLVLSNC